MKHGFRGLTNSKIWPWTLITENAERQIRHYCTPLQIEHQKPKAENYNSIQMSFRLIRTLLKGLILFFNVLLT